MVHKRGLGSLPKGLEWIEPRLDLEENTTPERAQEAIPASAKPLASPFLRPVDQKPVMPVQVTAIIPEEPQEILEAPEQAPKIVASPLVSKPVSQKKILLKAEELDNSASLKGLKEGWTRATFIVREEQVEKLKAVAYWERLTVKEVIEEAFTLYLQNKNVRKIPVRSRN